MSTTSIEDRFVLPAVPRDCEVGAGYGPKDHCAAGGEPRLLEMLSLSHWQRLTLETLAFLASIAALKHRSFGITEIPGMPHPYWLVVLLASSQYGLIGGMIATVAASVFYLFELSPQSAAQDFYDYAGTIAVQPTVWLATALVLGGLRSLQIYHTVELAGRLATCRQRASGLADGLERALAEIDALERRIAIDVSSVAALSRSFSKIDLSDRLAAAASFGELFRVGADTTTFTIYLKSSDRYVPVLAIEDDMPVPTKSFEPLLPMTIDAMMKEDAGCNATGQVRKSEFDLRRKVYLIPPSDVSTESLAAIVCQTQPPPQYSRQVHRRIEELSRAFAAILSACPDRPSGGGR